MMKLLSINQNIRHKQLDITSITESQLASCNTLLDYDYIIINGGDGTIRRVITTLETMSHRAKFILNPTGSFNVIAKLHRVPKLENMLDFLANDTTLKSHKLSYYHLNDELFLFSAGNMGDLQHIFLSETFRFDILKKGITKYILAALFLLPVHIIMTPFMLLSPRKFFIFTPASFIGKFGSFYGNVNKEITINLENDYNFIELDGDVVIIKERVLHIKIAGEIYILTKAR